MKKYVNPNKRDWSVLCERPSIEKNNLKSVVSEILDSVRRDGDDALIKYASSLDKVELEGIAVSEEEFIDAIRQVGAELKEAIQMAKQNIEKFHMSQLEDSSSIETMKGIECWRKSVGIDKVGLYIPGGTAPLFSTILMLGIPAKLAGCKEVVLCTPPGMNGKINPAILFTANLIGINKVYKVGGAQAIGAMAYGTKTIPNVYKIFGPGNQFVTLAKELIQLDGVSIDMPAGPSELLIIADETSNPSFVAADLLSQAEHGKDSQVILLSNSPDVLEKTLNEIAIQLDELPRKEIASEALKNSKSILLDSIEECLEMSNFYAPEHLIIASKVACEFADEITNAGSVFLGNYSCESAGDYASGTNHTLPTNGFAKNYSGVSVDSFVKKITFQNLTEEGLKNIGPAIELMAEAEDLMAHKNAVSIRLKSLKNV